MNKLLVSAMLFVVAATMTVAYNSHLHTYPYRIYSYPYGNPAYGQTYMFFDSSFQNPSVASRLFTKHSERYDPVYIDGYNDGFKDGFFSEFAGFQNPSVYTYRGVGVTSYGSLSDSRYNDGYNDGYLDGKETARYYKSQQQRQGFGQTSLYPYYSYYAR
jgi:hypothetical protein